MQTNQTKAQQMAADLLAYRTHYAALFFRHWYAIRYGRWKHDFQCTKSLWACTGRGDGTYPLASMGDEAMHTLTEEEIPSFSGNIEMHNSNNGNQHIWLERHI